MGVAPARATAEAAWDCFIIQLQSGLTAAKNPGSDCVVKINGDSEKDGHGGEQR